MKNQYCIRQAFEGPSIPHIPDTVREQMALFRPHLRPGMRVAIAVGSRGIHSIHFIVKTMVEVLKDLQTTPFIVPAMGSHGGANAEGQEAVLASYGIQESKIGCPILSAMEVKETGRYSCGLPVYCSQIALESDALLLVNRIKPHTDFVGSIGSGLMKMLVVGLGKHRGAATFHEGSSRSSHEEMILEGSSINAKATSFIGGLAIIENADHRPCHIEAVKSDQLEAKEKELHLLASKHLARLPFEEIDLLILDEIGKNISGTGMDTNVTGRGVQGYSSDLKNVDKRSPFIRRIFVRDLSMESHGNAIGIGNADFTTTRLVKAMDYAVSAVNAQTSLTPQSIKIPIHFESDRETIEFALKTLAKPMGDITIVRAKNTLDLEFLHVSESLMDEVKQNPKIEICGTVKLPIYDHEGNLLPLPMPIG